MNILILSQKIPYPPKDGGAIAVLQLALGLAKKGNHVTLLAFNPPKHFIRVQDVPEDIRQYINIHAVNVDTPIKPLPALKNLVFSKKPYIAVRFKNKSFQNSLNNILTNLDFDIVQIEGPYLAQYIPSIRSLTKARIIIRAHNIEQEIWHQQSVNTKNILKKYYLQNLAYRIKKFEKRVLNQADAILPITNRDSGIIKKIVNQIPLLVIPTGINNLPEAKESGNPLSEFFFIGSLEWFPNQEGLYWFFEKCWPEVLTNELARIHIAGRNAPGAFVKYLKKERVVFHGEVPDALDFMQQYNIMIAPLLSGSGMRIKILEAMAAGKCIITTNVGIEGIDAEHNKHLFIADNPVEFARWCIQLLQNPELAAKTAANAQKFARKHFDSNKITNTLHTFYENLVTA